VQSLFNQKEAELKHLAA
jgi:hypothetical protein